MFSFAYVLLCLYSFNIKKQLKKSLKKDSNIAIMGLYRYHFVTLNKNL